MTDQKLNELLGICRQLIEDGAVVESEVHCLNRCLKSFRRSISSLLFARRRYELARHSLDD